MIDEERIDAEEVPELGSADLPAGSVGAPPGGFPEDDEEESVSGDARPPESDDSGIEDEGAEEIPIPEKFVDSSQADVFKSYLNLQASLGVNLDNKSLVAMSNLPKEALIVAYTALDSLSGLPAAERAQIVRQMGYQLAEDEAASEDARPPNKEEQARAFGAEEYSRQEQQKLVQTAIAPQIYAADVSSTLTANPVYGVTEEELTKAIAEAGIPAREWLGAATQQRELFITQAARQIAYEKFMRGELAPPQAGKGPKAPAQAAPGVLGRGNGGARAAGDPTFESAVNNIMQTMGLSRKDAEEVVRG